MVSYLETDHSETVIPVQFWGVTGKLYCPYNKGIISSYLSQG